MEVSKTNLSVSGSVMSATTVKSSVSNEVVSNRFLAGLRVLAVDDDSTCLHILAKMLQTCHYQVTKCQRVCDALSILRASRSKFDIVISDVHMPDMAGLQLLREIVGLELDLPVVMMSSNDTNDLVMKVVIHGACDYLVKPVRMDAIRFLWQHVVRKQKNYLRIFQPSTIEKDGDKQYDKFNENDDNAFIDIEKDNCGGSNSENEVEKNKDKNNAASLKKQRMVWTPELHQQFVAAVNQIGLNNAVPKRILEIMNVLGLTRENVASHLQKYRLHLRKKMPGQYVLQNTIPYQDAKRSYAIFPCDMPFSDRGNYCDYDKRTYLSHEHPVMLLNQSTSTSVIGSVNVPNRDGNFGTQTTAFMNANLSISRNQDDFLVMEKMQNSLKIRKSDESPRTQDFNDSQTYHPISFPDFLRGQMTKWSENKLSVESIPDISFAGNRNLDINARYRRDDTHISPFTEHNVYNIDVGCTFQGYSKDGNSY